MQNNIFVDKYVSVARYEKDLDDIESSMDAADAEFQSDIVKITRSLVSVNDRLARWIVASSLAHVVPFAGIVVLAFS